MGSVATTEWSDALDALIQCWVSTHNREIRIKLIERCMPFAHYVLRQLRLPIKRNCLPELKSYAYEGLIFAVDHYDPKFKTKFFTYAYKCIRGIILTGYKYLLYRSKSTSSISSVRAYQKWASIESVCGRDSSVNRYSAEHNLNSCRDLSVAFRGLGAKLETDLSAHSSSSEFVHAESPLEQLLAFCDPEQNEDQVVVSNVVSLLSQSEQQLIDLHYYKGKTLREIATILGVSRGLVHKNLHIALRKIKNHLVVKGYGIS